MPCGLVDCRASCSLNVFRGANGASECCMNVCLLEMYVLKKGRKTHGWALMQPQALADAFCCHFL